jgi:GT2 family glycosyltransferase
MQIGFVFTNYNNATLTCQAVESLVNGAGWSDSRVVVVDNDSRPQDVQQLRVLQSRYPELRLILHDANVGYFPGLNLGLAFLRQEFPELSCVVAGNNDLLFPPDFHEQVQSCQDLLSRYAVLAPDLTTIDGVHQNPHVIRAISPIREVIWDAYYFDYRVARLIALIARVTRRLSRRADSDQHRTPQSIYQAYGACFILTPLFFQHFEQLWAPTFLMGEEYFLSHQVEAQGLELYYDPRIRVIHHEHASVARLPAKEFWKISKASHAVYREYVNPLRSRSRNRKLA